MTAMFCTRGLVLGTIETNRKLNLRRNELEALLRAISPHPLGVLRTYNSPGRFQRKIYSIGRSNYNLKLDPYHIDQHLFYIRSWGGDQDWSMFS
jgi:hypothetical protein